MRISYLLIVLREAGESSQIAEKMIRGCGSIRVKEWRSNGVMRSGVMEKWRGKCSIGFVWPALPVGRDAVLSVLQSQLNFCSGITSVNNQTVSRLTLHSSFKQDDRQIIGSFRLSDESIDFRD